MNSALNDLLHDRTLEIQWKQASRRSHVHHNQFRDLYTHIQILQLCIEMSRTRMPFIAHVTLEPSSKTNPLVLSQIPSGFELLRTRRAPEQSQTHMPQQMVANKVGFDEAASTLVSHVWRFPSPRFLK